MAVIYLATGSVILLKQVMVALKYDTFIINIINKLLDFTIIL